MDQGEKILPKVVLKKVKLTGTFKQFVDDGETNWINLIELDEQPAYQIEEDQFLVYLQTGIAINFETKDRFPIYDWILITNDDHHNIVKKEK